MIHVSSGVFVSNFNGTISQARKLGLGKPNNPDYNSAEHLANQIVSNFPLYLFQIFRELNDLTEPRKAKSLKLKRAILVSFKFEH